MAGSLKPKVTLAALCFACIPGHAAAQKVRRIRPVCVTGHPLSPGNLVLEEVLALGSGRAAW